MADMFAPLVAQLKANPKTIVFTEGNDPRILEAASKLLAEGVLKVVMVGNEAECKAAAAAGNFDISAAEIIDPENYAGFDEMVNTMVELRKGKQTAEECTALLKKSNYFGTMLVKMGKADCLLGGATYSIKEDTSPYTLQMKSFGKQAILPSLGFDKLLGDNKYITMAIPLSVLLAILVWIVMEKTMFGYELKATGFNKNAAKYCGMQEKRNTILTLVIAGALAGLGGSLLYQTGYEQWQCTASSVPAMGFNGIAATFLGGLNPIGTIFASFFIQHITAGGAYVDKSIYCSQVSDLISSLIIYLCAFVLFLKTAMNRWIFLHEERKAKKAEHPEKGGEA